MKLTVAKGLALACCFGITTGIAIPWLISNDILPVPIIMLGIFFIIMLWVIILENPIKHFEKRIKKLLKDFGHGQ